MEEKKCAICLKEKPLNKFKRNFANGRYYGYSKMCSSCLYDKYYRGKKYGKRFKWETATDAEKKLHVLKIITKNTARDNDGCLVWVKGFRKDGYAGMMYEGKFMAAHRVSWIIHKGPIPEGMWVLHSCDKPGCQEISHLFLGTAKDNWDDMVKKGRRKFKKGDDCNWSKLKEIQVIEIKKRLATGESATRLGYEFGVEAGTIKDIRQGKNWKHVKI